MTTFSPLRFQTPRYKVGYQLKFIDGQVHTVKSITFNNGEYIYHCNLDNFTETYLKDNVYLVFESEEARKEQEQPKLEEFGVNYDKDCVDYMYLTKTLKNRTLNTSGK